MLFRVVMSFQDWRAVTKTCLVWPCVVSERGSAFTNRTNAP